MINETTLTAIEIAKASVYNFSLIFSWAFFVISFAVLGLIFKSKGKWGFFWTVWMLSTVLTGVVVIFLVLSPEQVLNFIQSIKESWN